MTHVQQLRDEVLLQLYGAGLGLSLSAMQMKRTAERQGIQADEGDFTRAALFLVGMGHAARADDTATGQVRFTITAQGVLKKENG